MNVEFAGTVKFTWNFHKFNLFTPKFRKKFGEPAGGGVDPSMSEGNNPANEGLSWKQT